VFTFCRFWYDSQWISISAYVLAAAKVAMVKIRPNCCRKKTATLCCSTNAYAVLNPSESTYQATYKVYIGDQNTGVETSGYTGAEVQFDFIADPILTADFNEDSFVNSDDMAIWKQHFGTSSGATNDQGDTSSDGDVDGHDLLHWQRQFTGGEINSAIMLGSVPEPSTIVLALVAFGMMAVSRCGQ
jgi:hypothetical protein